MSNRPHRRPCQPTRKPATTPSSKSSKGSASRARWATATTKPTPLAIHRELHNRQGEADALGNLGLAHEAHGDLFEPIELFEQALLIYRDIGDRRGEAGALWISSLSFNKLGNRSAAVSNAEAALRIFEELADPTAATVRTQIADWRAAT
ncbi:MAG: tetratricopeptide repeat protein [Verrucomicrobia bacterium]|nr:tetratricopeptide repeat protein [Verrucomicrobiota bacterium]